MKYIKKKGLRPTGLLALLLSLLGWGGCDPFVEPEMYGTPTAHYSVKGTVTDEKGNPIEGIQVTVGVREYDGTAYYSLPIEAPVTTDQRGKWIREAQFFPADSIHIQVKDIDGAEHGGEFADYQTSLPVTIVKDPKNADIWFVGDATVDVQDIKLNKK